MFQWLFGHPVEVFSKGNLVFTSPLPGGLRLLLFAAAVAAAWFLYRPSAQRTSRRIYRTLIALRLAILVVLFFLLGGPVMRLQTPRSDTAFTAVLVDNSASMTIGDVGPTTRPRADVAREVVFGATDNPAPSLLKALDGQCQTVTYAFSDTAQRIVRPQQIDGKGQSTNIFRSIRDVDADLRGVPLSAMVLLTDGCRNSGGSTDEAARILQTRGIPLYILGIGNPNPPADLEVVQVLAPPKARRNSEVELDVTVRHTAFTDPFDLILKRGDDTITVQKIVPDGKSDISRLRLTFTPDSEGSATYSVEIPADKSEKFTQNNRREFMLDIQDDRLPVLYIEGSPRQEYRFLRRAMFKDESFRLVGVLRMAPNRFFVQGANGSEDFLKAGFPTTAEQLFGFQAVILGDIEADVFTPQQLELLEQFVKVRGGGLLMLGGVNSFGLGHWANTPVGRMLPLNITANDPPYSDDQYPAKVNDKELSHPVMMLALDANENKSIWASAPPLMGITPVSGVKSGATVLLKKEKGDLPVLAVQGYGLGRVGAFTSGGSWFWRMSKPASDEFQERFWKQFVRWLVVGVREQLTVSTDAEIYARRDPVTIRAAVLGKDMTPLNNARVLATITDPLGNAQEIPMDWILSEEGVYQCRYVPDGEGSHRIAVRVDGWESKPIEKGFLVSQPVAEFSDAAMKKEPLQEMARLTKGEFFDQGDSAKLIEAVKKKVKESATEAAVPQDKPLWDMPLLFVLILGMLGAEWLIRRRRGLA